MGLSLGGSLVISLPPIRISPLLGRSNPASIRSVVVLPQPEGPRKVTNSPCLMVRLKSFTATKPSSKARHRDLNSRKRSDCVLLLNAVSSHLSSAYSLILHSSVNNIRPLWRPYIVQCAIRQHTVLSFIHS